MKKKKHRKHSHYSKKTGNTRASMTVKKNNLDASTAEENSLTFLTVKENNWDPMANWTLTGEYRAQWKENTKDKAAFKRFIKQGFKSIISILLYRILNK